LKPKKEKPATPELEEALVILEQELAQTRFKATNDLLG